MGSRAFEAVGTSSGFNSDQPLTQQSAAQLRFFVAIFADNVHGVSLAGTERAGLSRKGAEADARTDPDGSWTASLAGDALILIVPFSSMP